MSIAKAEGICGASTEMQSGILISRISQKLGKLLENDKTVGGVSELHRIIGRLEGYPMTVAELSTYRIGRMLNDMRKKDFIDDNLKGRIRNLIKVWRGLADLNEGNQPRKTILPPVAAVTTTPINSASRSHSTQNKPSNHNRKSVPSPKTPSHRSVNNKRSHVSSDFACDEQPPSSLKKISSSPYQSTNDTQSIGSENSSKFSDSIKVSNRSISYSSKNASSNKVKSTMELMSELQPNISPQVEAQIRNKTVKQEDEPKSVLPLSIMPRRLRQEISEARLEKQRKENPVNDTKKMSKTHHQQQPQSVCKEEERMNVNRPNLKTLDNNENIIDWFFKESQSETSIANVVPNVQPTCKKPSLAAPKRASIPPQQNHQQQQPPTPQLQQQQQAVSEQGALKVSNERRETFYDSDATVEMLGDEVEKQAISKFPQVSQKSHDILEGPQPDEEAAVRKKRKKVKRHHHHAKSQKLPITNFMDVWPALNEVGISSELKPYSPAFALLKNTRLFGPTTDLQHFKPREWRVGENCTVSDTGHLHDLTGCYMTSLNAQTNIHVLPWCCLEDNKRGVSFPSDWGSQLEAICQKPKMW